MDEELINRHKQEKKDLQAKIQSLKKTCTKGDKKKKKETAEQILKLEKDLDERHSKEIGDLSMVTEETADPVTIKDDPLEADETDDVGPGRISKAQKRRNKKAAEDRDREERISRQEKENKNGPRILENKQIKELLTKRGLQLVKIPPDGNCLYCAVNHQLEITGRKAFGVDELRKVTADYMREHKDDFLPFMSHDTDEVFTEGQYEEYCVTLESTTAWGGQLEIMAMSNILRCPIQVIQAETLPTVQGEEYTGPPLVLTYHRYLYGLGEHYNSTVTANA